jgi:hypothetical protein
MENYDLKTIQTHVGFEVLTEVVNKEFYPLGHNVM